MDDLRHPFKYHYVCRSFCNRCFRTFTGIFGLKRHQDEGCEGK